MGDALFLEIFQVFVSLIVEIFRAGKRFWFNRIINHFHFFRSNFIFIKDHLAGIFRYSKHAVSTQNALVFNFMDFSIAIRPACAVKFGGMNV